MSGRSPGGNAGRPSIRKDPLLLEPQNGNVEPAAVDSTPGSRATRARRSS